MALHHLLSGLALILLFLFLLDWLPGRIPLAKPTLPAARRPEQKPPRPLRPRTPRGLPRLPRRTNHTEPRTHRHGAPKRLNTKGYACPNSNCPYYGLTDSRIHALVGYGHHGLTDPIQDLFCQACHRKFTARRNTPLYRLKISAARVASVLTAPAEGLSVAGAVHTFDHAEATIARWQPRFRGRAEHIYGRFFSNLRLLQVQLDELRTTLHDKGREVWVWVALDAKSKVIKEGASEV